MAKFFLRLLSWVILPGLFLSAIYFGDPQLALVGATIAWAIPIILGPLALIVLCVSVTIKPSDPKWAENKEEFEKAKPGFLSNAISWFALILTISLSAYAGFIITAVFYLIGCLWAKLSHAIVLEHFKKNEK